MKLPINHLRLLLAADRDIALEWAWPGENALLKLARKAGERLACGEADEPSRNPKRQQELAPSFPDSWPSQSQMPI
jgi:hypothetical protein